MGPSLEKLFQKMSQLSMLQTHIQMTCKFWFFVNAFAIDFLIIFFIEM